MKNPWLYKMGDRLVQAVSAEDRIFKLKSLNETELRAVIAWPDTQKTVRARAEAQLKRVRRSKQ